MLNWLTNKKQIDYASRPLAATFSIVSLTGIVSTTLLMVMLLTIEISFAANVSFPEREKLALSQRLIAERDYNRAISILSDLASRYAANAEVAYWFGVALSYAGRFDEAFEHLDRSIELAPTNIKLRLEYAKILTNANRYDEAEKYSLSTLALTSDLRERAEVNRLIAIVRGKKLVNAKRYDDAIQHFQAATQEYPNDNEMLSALADVYMSLERWQDAEQLYRFLQSKDPRYTANLLKLLTIAGKTGDETTKQRLLQSLVQETSDPRIQESIENVLLRQVDESLKNNQYARAVGDLSSILRANPNHLKANLAMVDLYMMQDKNEEAYNTLKYIEQQNRDRLEITKIVAPYYARLGKAKESIAQYEKILASARDEALRKETNASLTLLYNFYSNQLLADTKDKETGANDLQELVSTAKEWVNKSRDDAAKPILEFVLQHDSKNAEAHYWLATVLDRRRQFDLAIDNMKSSLSLSNGNLAVRIALARIQARAGQFDEAETNYQRIVDETKDPAQAAEMSYLLDLVIGQRYAKQGKFNEAITHYESMLAERPNDSTIKMQLANLYLDRSNYSSAETILSGLVNQFPENPGILWQLATLYEKTGRSDDRDRTLRQVLRVDPNGFFGLQSINLLGMGEAKRKQKEKKWDEAISWYEKVLRMEPKNIAALIGMSDVQINIGDLESAAGNLDRARNLDPANEELHLILAKLFVKQDRVNEAIIELSRAIALSNDASASAEARANLVNLYRIRAEGHYSSGNIEQALRDYQELYRLNPQDVSARLQVADTYLEYGNQQQNPNLIKRALREYEKVLEVDPENADAYANKGKIHEMFDQFDLARDAFAYALASSRDSRYEARLVNDLKRQVVQLQYAEKNYDWALTELQDMQRREPGNENIYYFLAIVYTNAEDYENAIAQYLKIIELNPNNMQIRVRLAELYERTNEDLLAAAQYRLILQNTNDTDLQNFARQRLPVAEDRARFLSSRFSYSSTHNLLRAGETSIYLYDFITYTRADFNFRFRPRKDLLLNIGYAPTYTSSHGGETDSLFHSYSANLGGNQRKKIWSVNLSYRDGSDLLAESYLGSETSATLTAGQRYDFPLFRAENEPLTPRFLQLVLNVRDIKSKDLTFYDVINSSMTLQLMSPFGRGGVWAAGYRFTSVGNRRVEAADYAYLGNRASLDINLPISPKLSSVFSLAMEAQNFLFYDSWVLADQNVYRRRKIFNLTSTATLTYEIHRQVMAVFDLAWDEYRSSLGLGAFGADAGSGNTYSRTQAIQLADQRNLSTTLTLQFRF